MYTIAAIRSCQVYIQCILSHVSALYSNETIERVERRESTSGIRGTLCVVLSSFLCTVNRKTFVLLLRGEFEVNYGRTRAVCIFLVHVIGSLVLPLVITIRTWPKSFYFVLLWSFK